MGSRTSRKRVSGPQVEASEGLIGEIFTVFEIEILSLLIGLCIIAI
jgi:hypothetical protein